MRMDGGMVGLQVISFELGESLRTSDEMLWAMIPEMKIWKVYVIAG